MAATILLVLSAISLTAFASIYSPEVLEMNSNSSSCRNLDNSIDVTLSCTFSCSNFTPSIKLFDSFNIKGIAETFIFYTEGTVCSNTAQEENCPVQCNAENTQNKTVTYTVHGAITAQARIKNPCLYTFECHSQNAFKEKSFTFEDCAMMQPNICGTSATTNISSDLYLECTPDIVVTTVELSPTSCSTFDSSTVRQENCTLYSTFSLEQPSPTPCICSESATSGSSSSSNSGSSSSSYSSSSPLPDAEPSKDLGLIVGITVPGIALAILLLIAIVIIAVVVNIKKSKLRSNKVIDIPEKKELSSL